MIWRAFGLIISLLSLLFLGNGNPPLGDLEEQVRVFTRPLEFDYWGWTLDAISLKLEQAALGSDRYLNEDMSRQHVLDYITLISQIQQAEAELAALHSNPDAKSIALQIEGLGAQLDSLYSQRQQLRPQTESLLQSQLAEILSGFGLSYAGQAIPPVLFHSTPLPWTLIVSQRNTIGQEANISLETELRLDEHIALEESVAASLDVSTLVVPVGGIGSYPTMVAQSSHLNWIVEVISHEWVHNYLTLRPLGLLYERNQELRTMNETAATIAGKELGAALILRFYPELAPPPPQPPSSVEAAEEDTEFIEEVGFDFRAEMHATRIRVDELLSMDKIEEAEEYMEARRLIFWENGFPIRKLNQAYFAFYGSYADSATGPAGEDPVGEAVRALREDSSSLAEFLKEMAFLSSFEQLKLKLD